MQDDEQLDRLIEQVRDEWRVAPPAPRDEMWERIEAQAFAPRWKQRTPGWSMVGVAAAAALLIGVAVGRTTATRSPALAASDVPPTTVTVVSADDPYTRATEELLGQTALLLAALPEANIPSGSTGVIARQGGELLTTTRVLLDSPAGVKPEMRALLEDLELVLAQVARLRAPASGDLDLIHDALDRNEIVPRLRSAVIGSSEALN